MRKLLETHLGHRAIFIMGHILQDKYVSHCCKIQANHSYLSLTVMFSSMNLEQ